MSLGLREERRRRRRHNRSTVLRWLLALGFVVGAGAYAYQTGARLAERSVATLDEQLRTQHATVDDLRAKTQAQSTEIAQERARAEDWRQRYEQDVPTGEMKAVFDLVQAKLARGVSAERLRWVLNQTENRRDCDQNPQVRRLLVQTPISGAKTSATFSGGTVAVSINGVSARDAAGNPEAWFDLAQPVTVRLTWPGGKTSEAAGPLPLHPSLVQVDREYRFSIVPGPRGFAHITMERCRFP